MPGNHVVPAAADAGCWAVPLGAAPQAARLLKLVFSLLDVQMWRQVAKRPSPEEGG